MVTLESVDVFMNSVVTSQRLSQGQVYWASVLCNAFFVIMVTYFL